MPHTTICPKCHAKSRVDESLIGRFITCDHCKCLYYVVVPPLGEERSELQSIPATSAVIERSSAGSDRPSSTETEKLQRRINLLTALVVLNLLIGAALLILVLRMRASA